MSKHGLARENGAHMQSQKPGGGGRGLGERGSPLPHHTVQTSLGGMRLCQAEPSTKQPQKIIRELKTWTDK